MSVAMTLLLVFMIVISIFVIIGVGVWMAWRRNPDGPDGSPEGSPDGSPDARTIPAHTALLIKESTDDLNRFKCSAEGFKVGFATLEGAQRKMLRPSLSGVKGNYAYCYKPFVNEEYGSPEASPIKGKAFRWGTNNVFCESTSGSKIPPKNIMCQDDQSIKYGPPSLSDAQAKKVIMHASNPRCVKNSYAKCPSSH